MTWWGNLFQFWILFSLKNELLYCVLVALIHRYMWLFLDLAYLRCWPILPVILRPPTAASGPLGTQCACIIDHHLEISHAGTCHLWIGGTTWFQVQYTMEPPCPQALGLRIPYCSWVSLLSPLQKPCWSRVSSECVSMCCKMRLHVICSIKLQHTLAISETGLLL